MIGQGASANKRHSCMTRPNDTVMDNQKRNPNHSTMSRPCRANLSAKFLYPKKTYLRTEAFLKKNGYQNLVGKLVSYCRKNWLVQICGDEFIHSPSWYLLLSCHCVLVLCFVSPCISLYVYPSISLHSLHLVPPLPFKSC